MVDMAHDHQNLYSYFTLPFFLAMFVFPFVHMYPSVRSQLDYNFYDTSCPRLQMMVRYTVWAALRNDTRMAASLLRLHFHDCIVNVKFLFLTYICLLIIRYIRIFIFKWTILIEINHQDLLYQLLNCFDNWNLKMKLGFIWVHTGDLLCLLYFTRLI